MQTPLILFFLLTGLAAAALLVAGRVIYARRLSGLERSIATTPPPVLAIGPMPGLVRDFATRAGARPGDLVHRVDFSQAAHMRLKPAEDWQRIEARQSIATGASAFVWQARQPWGPLPKFEVLDAYTGGQGQLLVRLLGLIRIARASGPDIDRAEAMRYLAELPWAPDAILGNPDIAWRQISATTVEARLDDNGWQAAVELRFDAHGDIYEVFAPDRPAIGADGKTELLPWKGVFSEYRMIGPRRVPALAEVGYVYPDGYRAYFRCRITQYSVTP